MPACRISLSLSLFAPLVSPPPPPRMTCPARKDEADWLVELTGDAGTAYRTDIETGGARGLVKAPVTADEFHARWRESEGGKAVDQARTGTFYSVEDIQKKLLRS